MKLEGYKNISNYCMAFAEYKYVSYLLHVINW